MIRLPPSPSPVVHPEVVAWFFQHLGSRLRTMSSAVVAVQFLLELNDMCSYCIDVFYGLLSNASKMHLQLGLRREPRRGSLQRSPRSPGWCGGAVSCIPMNSSAGLLGG